MTTVITTDFYNRYSFKSDRKEYSDSHWDFQEYDHAGNDYNPSHKVRVWFFADKVDVVRGDECIGSELVASVEKVEVLDGCLISFLNYAGSLEGLATEFSKRLNGIG